MRRYRDGTTHVFFDPLDFIVRFVALIPKPRVNLLRFHGVFAPNSNPRWYVKSGDHICRHLAFATRQMASYWLDKMINDVTRRDGPEFHFMKGLFKCSIVKRKEELPKHWGIEPYRYDKDYHNYLRHRYCR